jgi:hypothetical protein
VRRGEERRGEERRGEKRRGEKRRGEKTRGEKRRGEERRGERRRGEEKGKELRCTCVSVVVEMIAQRLRRVHMLLAFLERPCRRSDWPF